MTVRGGPRLHAERTRRVGQEVHAPTICQPGGRSRSFWWRTRQYRCARGPGASHSVARVDRQVRGRLSKVCPADQFRVLRSIALLSLLVSSISGFSPIYEWLPDEPSFLSFSFASDVPLQPSSTLPSKATRVPLVSGHRTPGSRAGPRAYVSARRARACALRGDVAASGPRWPTAPGEALVGIIDLAFVDRSRIAHVASIELERRVPLDSSRGVTALAQTVVLDRLPLWLFRHIQLLDPVCCPSIARHVPGTRCSK